MAGASVHEFMRHDYHSVDWLFSARNVTYTQWQRTFAWRPVVTVTGRSVWFRTVWRRERNMVDHIPQFPLHHLDQTQFATTTELLERQLSGLP